MATSQRGSRTALLEATIDHLASAGVSDTSLRAIAKGIGTSHRMLSYHFDSREGLLEEVSLAVEARQRAALDQLLAEETSPAHVMWKMYRQVSDPALAPYTRLFFELYVRAIETPSLTRTPANRLVNDWLGVLTDLFSRLGFTKPQARAEARLALAVARGLLLDLLATGDRKAADAAMRRFLTRYRDAEGA